MRPDEAIKIINSIDTARDLLRFDQIEIHFNNHPRPVGIPLVYFGYLDNRTEMGHSFLEFFNIDSLRETGQQDSFHGGMSKTERAVNYHRQSAKQFHSAHIGLTDMKISTTLHPHPVSSTPIFAIMIPPFSASTEFAQMKGFLFLGVSALLLSACGGHEVVRPTVSVSIGQQLIDLKQARANGAVSQSEYERQRRNLIDSVE